MPHRYFVRLKDAESLAKRLGATLSGGETLALVGPLGSGKTTFTKALAKTLHIHQSVVSPTFILMSRYHGWANVQGKKKPIWLYHLDLYRTKDLAEVKALGLSEVWSDPSAIVAIEWADKIKALLPKNTITIKFSR